MAEIDAASHYIEANTETFKREAMATLMGQKPRDLDGDGLFDEHGGDVPLLAARPNKTQGRGSSYTERRGDKTQGRGLCR